jgi:type II secretory pathway component PulK
MPKAAARSRGFALLIVLWTLVLIAFVVAQVTAAGRTEIRIAGNLAANAAAQAAADGAIYEAIFHLADPRPEQRWALDGSEHALRIGQSRITLRLEDEAAASTRTALQGSCCEACCRLLATRRKMRRSLPERSPNGSARPVPLATPQCCQRNIARPGSTIRRRNRRWRASTS